MLPLIVDTLSVAGRPGSESGTEIFCSPSPVVRGAAGAAIKKLRIRVATSDLMAFSIQEYLEAHPLARCGRHRLRGAGVSRNLQRLSDRPPHPPNPLPPSWDAATGDRRSRGPPPGGKGALRPPSYLGVGNCRWAPTHSGPLPADQDVAVDRAEAQLGAAAGDARREIAVAAIVEMAPRAIGGLRRQAAVVIVVIGIDLAVQRLEPQVGGEAVEEGHLDAAIDGVERAAGGGVAAEAGHHRAVDAPGHPGSPHALESHRSVDVADVEAAADPADPHLAAVHRAGDEIDVGWPL